MVRGAKQKLQVCAIVWGLMAACDGASSGPQTVDFSALNPQRGLHQAGDVSDSIEFDKLDPNVWNNTGSDKDWSIDKTQNAVYSSGSFHRSLWLKKPLSDYARVQFEVWTEDTKGDLRFEIFGDGEHHESGYVLVFGAWQNMGHLIARQDEHWTKPFASDTTRHAEHTRVMILDGPKVEKGRHYKMNIVRTDGELRWFVDGELLMSYPDPKPLQGPGHRYFGISSWESSIYVSNITLHYFKNPGETP